MGGGPIPDSLFRAANGDIPGLKKVDTSDATQDIPDGLFSAAAGTDAAGTAEDLRNKLRKSLTLPAQENTQQLPTPRGPGLDLGGLFGRPAEAPLPTFAAEATQQTDRLPTAEEATRGRKQLPGESRVQYLKNTQAAADIYALKTSKSVLRQAPDTWWKQANERLGNMRLLSGGDVISFHQTPGGIDIGGAARFAQQLWTPTAGELVHGNAKTAFDNFINITGGLGKGLIDPFITQPAALIYDAANRNDYLLPEERSQYLRNTIANYAGLYFGAAAGEVYAGSRNAVLLAGRTKGFISPTVVLSEIPSIELAKLAQVPSQLGFRARLAKGVVEGSFGGAVTGFVDAPTPEERLDYAATYSLMAVPLGLAWEAIHSGKINPRDPLVAQAKLAADASQLYNLRQVRLGEQATADQAAQSFYNLAKQKDLAKAALRASEDRPVVIPGLTHEDALDVQQFADRLSGKPAGNAALTGQNLSMTTHYRPDGKADVLVMPSFTTEGETSVSNRFARDMFAVAGHLPDSHVSFLGQDYSYVGPLLDKSGKLEGHIIRDMAGENHEVPWNMVQRGPDVAISAFEADKPSMQEALWKSFKRSTQELFTNGKFNADAIPEKGFDELVDNFARVRALNPNEIQPLRDFLATRMMEEVRKDVLSPAENGQYLRMVHEAQRIRDNAPQDIVDLVNSSGYYLERNGGAAILLRDGETGSVVERFNSIEGVRKFVQDAGMRDGVNLDNGGRNGLPPNGTGRVGSPGLPPPENGPQIAPYNFVKDGPMRQFSHWFNTTLLGTHMTGMRQIMIALDQQFGTRFFSEVYAPNDIAFRKKHAAMNPDLRRASATAQFARGMTPDELDHVTSLLHTMSPEELIQQGGAYKNRRMSAPEIESAKWFVDHQIDMAKVYQFRNARNELQFRYKGQDRAYTENLIAGLANALNMDSPHLEATKLVDDIVGAKRPDDLDIYGITRLTNAIMHGEVSAADYAVQNKLSPKQIKLAEMIREHLKDLSVQRPGVVEEPQLAGYFAHYRVLKDDVNIPNEHGAPIKVSDLLRDGDMSEYDRDPINILVRHLNRRFNSEFTEASWNAARDYIDRATAGLGDNGPYIAKLLKDNYLNELRGIPHDSSRLEENVFGKTLDRLGINVNVNVRRDIVNTWLSLISSGTIGFRPQQGLRDLNNFVSIFYSRNGAARTTDMLTMMSRVSGKDLVEMGVLSKTLPGESATKGMQREGVIPTISPISVLTAEERLQNSLAGKTSGVRQLIQETGNAGIKFGLQHNVYEWAHAASYLEGYSRALKVLNDMVVDGRGNDGVAAKAKAYKKLSLDTFDLPVAKEFDRLVATGKFEDAAKLLGNASSFETVSVFGLANHPAAWGTNLGRIAGQFGTWPTWARVQLYRGATRGTLGNRAAFLSRFAMSQGAIKGASFALGLNLNSWYLPFAFPVIASGQTMTELADSYDRQKQAGLAVKAAMQLVGGTVGTTIFPGGPAVQAAGAVTDLANPYSGDDNDAVRTLTRMWMTPIPGAYAVNDIVEGAKLAGAGYNPISAFARALGIRSLQQPSALNPYGVPNRLP